MANDIVVVPPAEDPSPLPDPRAASPWDDLEQRQANQVLDWREKYASAALGILQTWVGFIIVITIAQMSLKSLGLGLDKNEFIALVTTTTASVVLLAHIVGKFLFPEGGSTKSMQKPGN